MSSDLFSTLCETLTPTVYYCTHSVSLITVEPQRRIQCAVWWIILGLWLDTDTAQALSSHSQHSHLTQEHLTQARCHWNKVKEGKLSSQFSGVNIFSGWKVTGNSRSWLRRRDILPLLFSHFAPRGEKQRQNSTPASAILMMKEWS